MTDTRLRELERRWRQTGLVEDEAAWLRERVRVGDLARNMLELAAYLGHPPARLALGNQAPTPHEDPKTLVQGLSQWGKECCVRAALSSAQSCLPILAGQHPDDNIPQKAIEATINWIVNPNDQTKAAANNAASLPTNIDLEAERAVAFTALAASADREYSWFFAAKAAFAADMAAHRTYVCAQFDALLGRGEAKATNIPQVRQAIINDLIPWALGYSDPVRERVEARQRQQTGTS